MGYKILPVASKMNGRLCRRPDIKGVYYHGEFVMTIPERMYGFRSKRHRDLNGIEQPDYFYCEALLFRQTMHYGKY